MPLYRMPSFRALRSVSAGSHNSVRTLGTSTLSDFAPAFEQAAVRIPRPATPYTSLHSKNGPDASSALADGAAHFASLGAVPPQASRTRTRALAIVPGLSAHSIQSLSHVSATSPTCLAQPSAPTISSAFHARLAFPFSSPKSPTYLVSTLVVSYHAHSFHRRFIVSPTTFQARRWATPCWSSILATLLLVVRYVTSPLYIACPHIHSLYSAPLLLSLLLSLPLLPRIPLADSPSPRQCTASSSTSPHASCSWGPAQRARMRAPQQEYASS